jgi:hypothetical protein
MDEMFSDLKGDYVFNFLDDLVVNSPSPAEHARHVREVLRRLQAAGFTLNPEVTFGAREIKYLGHVLSARGIQVFHDRVAAIGKYPRPTNPRKLRRFLGMVGFYPRFFPTFLLRLLCIMH